MAQAQLAAEVRTAFGKGAARKIRRDDKIPAVVYGHGMEPVHLTLPGHDTMMVLKVKNALIDVSVDDNTKHLVVVKSVQRDPIKRTIEHVDLIVVSKGEKISVEVPLHIEGQAGPATMVTMEHTSVPMRVEATNIPEGVTFELAGREAGNPILARDITLPEGAELDCDETMMLVNIAALSKATEEEAEGEEEAAAEEGAAE